MRATSGLQVWNLRLIGLLSSVWIALATAASSHEVNPTIGDLSVNDGQLTLQLRMNVEAFVAGINLDGLANTNEADQSDNYDMLRALEPDPLRAEVERFVDSWLPYLVVETAGSRGQGPREKVAITLDSLNVSDVGDVGIPRTSSLILRGTLPAGARTLTLTWPKRAGNLALRQQGVEEPYTAYLAGGETTPPISLSGGGQQTGLQAFASYVPVGYAHILPKGLDHILFVLALFFLSTHLRPLLWQVTTFTVAHTVSLALGSLGIVQVSPAIVEPLIAASIAFVAIENLFTNVLHKWRPVVVFGFGLLHGLGFAAVLMEFGLPQDQFVPALLGFNVGVELGQLTVIAIAFFGVTCWLRNKPWYRQRVAVPASAAIAVIALYWTFERVFL